jgi:hypothetical protein
MTFDLTVCLHLPSETRLIQRDIGHYRQKPSSCSTCPRWRILKRVIREQGTARGGAETRLNREIKGPTAEIDRMSLNGIRNAIVFAGPVLAGPETSSRKKDKGPAMMR